MRSLRKYLFKLLFIHAKFWKMYTILGRKFPIYLFPFPLKTFLFAKVRQKTKAWLILNFCFCHNSMKDGYWVDIIFLYKQHHNPTVRHFFSVKFLKRNHYKKISIHFTKFPLFPPKFKICYYTVWNIYFNKPFFLKSLRTGAP